MFYHAVYLVNVFHENKEDIQVKHYYRWCGMLLSSASSAINKFSRRIKFDIKIDFKIGKMFFHQIKLWPPKSELQPVTFYY